MVGAVYNCNTIRQRYSMTNEEISELQNHVRAISEILYRDTENTEPEKLKTLEGIETAVREQVQKHVSSEIGVFLLARAQAQHQVGADK
jgi:hypothetical protein